MRRLTSLALLALLVMPARADVSVALTPATQTVTPGSDFDVFVDVTAAGSAWNGWELAVGFDPAALTLLPASPTTSQQGCYMTGGCSSACGNTFHVFSTAGDSAAISDVLLCNQVTLAGPGRVYHLRFHSTTTAQATQLTVRRVNFYNAGVFVTPVHATGCTVGIGVNVGVGDTPIPHARPLRAEPNPTSGRVEFLSSDDMPAVADIRIVDLQGRSVRSLGPVLLGGHGRIAWDGRDAHGVPAAPGLYLVHVRRGVETQTLRVIRIP